MAWPRAVACCTSLAAVAGPALAQSPSAEQPAATAPATATATATVQAPAPAASATTALQPLKVRARAMAADRSAPTEGTGAYHAESTSTATGLNLSPRETPQAVTVITRQRIEDQALATVTDIVNAATGVTAKEYDSHRHGYKARGFDISSLLHDGLPMAWEASWAGGETLLPAEFYDRVEVVRGAAGLVAGVGDPGAAINLVQKRATARTLTGQAQLSLGSRSLREGMVDVSAPLDARGDLRGRVVALAGQQDSWRRYAQDNRQLLLATLGADLGPRTQLDVSWSVQRNDPKGPTWGALPTWYADGSDTDFGLSDTTAARWTRWLTDNRKLNVDLRHTLAGGWSLRGVLQRVQTESHSKLLYLYGHADATTGLGMSAWPGRYDTERTQDDLSLRASGPLQLFGRRHELSVNLHHARQDFAALGWGFDWAALDSVGDIRAWDGSYAEPAWTSASPYESYETRQTALSAVGRFSLADDLKLIAGLRQTRWRKDVTSSGVKLQADRLTPYLGLVLDLDERLSAYASHTSIFKPQTERDRYGAYLAPVIGRASEVGLKGDFLDGRLQGQASLFHIRQDGLAQTDTGQYVPGTSPPVEASYASEGATSRGYELELTGSPSADWQLSAGWSHFIAEDAQGQAVNSDHPRRTLKLHTRWRLPAQWQAVTVGGGVNWESAVWADGSNPLGQAERVSQGAYALVSLMARWQVQPALALQLNVDNALDKRYYSQVGFYSSYGWGAPRTTRLSARYSF
ncbi:MAG: putative TonB-dependent receptor [Pseudomonadota bacterium]